MRAKQEEWDRQAAEVARLHATTPDQLYHADLDAFEAALDERDEEDAREAELLVTQRGRAGRAGGAKVYTLITRAGKEASVSASKAYLRGQIQLNFTSQLACMTTTCCISLGV